MKLLPSIPIFLLIFLPSLAGAQDITISPCDQNGINTALSQVYSSGGGSVYLNAGTYDVTGQIRIGSNTRLTGSPDTIIRVSSASNQWFVDGVGIIGAISEPVSNIEIDSIQLDGNLKAFNPSWANSGSGDHNAERLIDLRASEGNRANDIKIHDLKLHDSFSDALHIAFANNVNLYNIFCSDCQHSSIYFIDCLTGEINNNEVAGICSDDIRLDNCQYIKVHDNLLYSFIGDSGGKYQTGENGLQAGDQGFSHGGGSPKPDHTSNLDIYNNTFAGKMLRAVWLDADGLTKGNNVYVHDNRYVGIEGINTSGISFTNPPTVEMSEYIFKSIFDILNQTFTDSGFTTQTADNIQYTVQQTNQGAIAGGIKIIGFSNVVSIDGVNYIPDNKSILVKYAAVKAPSFAFVTGGSSRITSTVNTSIVNGTAYATLNVKLETYTVSKNPITKKTKTNYHVSTATFNDSCKSSDVLEIPKTITGTIYQYPTFFMVYVPSQGLTKIHYDYAGNSTEHIFYVGTRNNSSSVEYTEFSSLEHWEGNLQHSGNWLYVLGDFNQSKLKVTAYTPYEKESVSDFNITKFNYPKSIIANWFYPEIAFLVISLIFLKWLFNQIKDN